MRNAFPLGVSDAVCLAALNVMLTIQHKMSASLAYG